MPTTTGRLHGDEYCDLFMPCRNGGTCVNGNYVNGNLFSCICPQGFYGKTCEAKG